MEENAFTNRLINEKSPYLQQHAHNPVDWYPWGSEAFERAKRENKPIFLSIGYSTCHWCHVMEQESFEDPEVAEALNNAFISVKIDREELPEIDSLYMELAQTMIWGSAGWPLNLLLTPDLKPFFASTYLPKRSSRGLVGVIELTEKIQELWKSDEQDRLVAQAEKVVDILRSHVHVQGQDLPTDLPITQTAEILFKIADPIWGGMKGAPKFPLGYQANFLIRFYLRTQDSRALFLVEKTLEMMHRGGIYDHLGGGFHRYSVDEHWHVPHFEKMLYDNAIVAYAYLEAGKVTKRPIYNEVCQEVLDYIVRDMQNPDGGFYSAEDADTEGVEGLFYTWTRKEVLNLLGEEMGHLISDFYGIYDHGVVEGRSVLHLALSLEEFATSRGIPLDECKKQIQKAKDELYKERSRRGMPLKDDKIITSWNGLTIFALSEAAFTLHRMDYSYAAVQAAKFIKENLFKEGRLFRRYREGDVRFQAGLEDYAFLIKGLLSLFQSGQGTEWLAWAMELTDILEREFKSRNGAFYQTTLDTDLIVRKSHFADGAEPSGNAVHAENLLLLWQLTGNAHYLEQAEDLFRAVKRFVDTYPLGYCYHLQALQRYFDVNKAIVVIAFNSQEEGKEEIIKALAEKKSPHHAQILLSPQDTLLPRLIGDLAKPPIDNKTTLYLCHEGVCKAPLNDKEALLKALSDL